MDTYNKSHHEHDTTQQHGYEPRCAVCGKEASKCQCTCEDCGKPMAKCSCDTCHDCGKDILKCTCGIK